MPNFQSFKEILKEELKEREMTLDQLAEITEISPRYLRALVESDTDNLPPAPYIRGYLQKIADALSVDFSMLWKYYENDQAIKKSGSTDTLPLNRFALKPINKTALVFVAVFVVALALFFPTLVDFFGRPSFEILTPLEEMSFSDVDHATISGKVKRPQDTVYINNTEVPVGEDGSFSKDVPLSEGANSFEVLVRRFLGRETTGTRNIFYRTQPFVDLIQTPAESEILTPTNSPSPSPSPEI